MSGLVFPTFAGLQFPVIRTVDYKTLVEISASLRSAQLPLQPYPIYTWTIDLGTLRDALAVSEIRQIVGFFNACRGRYDSFLYSDPVFNSVTAEPFGVGDGHTTQFQLIAAFHNSGGAVGPDIVQTLNGAPQIFDNGSPAGTYSLGPSGIVTFVTAPAANHALTWTGNFYYRCHFMSDSLLTTQFLYRVWETKKLSFRSHLL